MILVKWPPFRKWHLVVNEDDKRTYCGVYIRSGQIYTNEPVRDHAPDTLCFNCVFRKRSERRKDLHQQRLEEET